MKCFAVLAAFASLAFAQTGPAPIPYPTGMVPVPVSPVPTGTGMAPYPGSNGTVPVGTATGTLMPSGGVGPTTPVAPIYTGAAAQVGGSLLAVVAAGVVALA